MVTSSTALFLLYYTFSALHSTSSTDTITHANSLRDGDTIVSNGGTFALGFFSPPSSQHRYIGIWYNKIPIQTVVWVANRNNPINTSSPLLKIDDRSNLAIFNGNQTTPVWSTNLSLPITQKTSSSSLFYKLLDSGNLVLCDQNRGENRGASPVFLWQSFDDPTDTFLAGMKLGLNLTSGAKWSLTSPNGEFLFELNRTGSPEFYLKKGSNLIWRSGTWNGRSWSGVPEMTRGFIFNYSFVDGPDEIYITYTVYNKSILSRFVLDDLGAVRRWTWVDGTHRWTSFWSAPRDACDEYGQCGRFGMCNSSNNNGLICSCLPGFAPKSPRDWYLRDGSQGCVRKREALCGEGGEGEGFLKLEKVKIPDGANARVDMSLGIKDCEVECRNNCSCTGYAVADVSGVGSGCIAWFGDLIDIREYTDGGQDLFVRVDAIELENSMRTSKSSFLTKKKLVLLVVLLVVGILILMSVMYYLVKRTKRRGLARRERVQMQLLSLSNSDSYKGSSPCPKEYEEANANFELPFFDLDDVMVATENFSWNNKLGSGGFGSVYKGRLSDGREIAVKRLSRSSGQGTNEFKNEVVLIARLQHRNLVQILGCCVEKDEKMLIYEYMPNKSLDFFLFDPTKSTLLDWPRRYEIILGIARGVLYLHQDSRLRIIHRDLKASNILLDAEMNPKISDFGMARIFGSKQTQANTDRVVGTYGYMAPEYAMDGQFSIKSDVFSFGVLLLEIISGKKNNGYYHEDPLMNMIKHAWELWKDGRPLELVDPSLGNSYPEQDVIKCIKVGILCVQENAKDRPTMSSVIAMLGNEATIPPVLKQPAFVPTTNPKYSDSSISGTGSRSINEMSTTIVEGR
ncbi:hypothetical protein Syun_027100 [Stephania yunnanensis]|uniref:Receptor-like serine/threonine-protein kinase n=1 Tax=Stephania yunnanensis TaxID=152371 RepID=A0AAP0HMG4_9MAGN